MATLQYAQSFRCIGSACEDTCCHGWRVPIDEATYERYQALPPGPLSALIRENVAPASESERAKNPSIFAIIRMNAENSCPMLSEDRLCRIQSEYGETLLSHTCATYPRIVHADTRGSITALTLSCPEAARLVLLHPGLMATCAYPDTKAPPDPEPGPQPKGQRRAKRLPVGPVDRAHSRECSQNCREPTLPALAEVVSARYLCQAARHRSRRAPA